jgi:hypothetical protein
MEHQALGFTIKYFTKNDTVIVTEVHIYLENRNFLINLIFLLVKLRVAFGEIY